MPVPRLLAGVLIVAAAALHVAYLTSPQALDLAPDEAHYWDWSRRLDWSYYSKGPLVAYLIRGGCLLFGDTPLGVRAPAVLCGSLLLVAVYVLTARVFRREGLALAAVALALTLPPVAAGSTLMTIDAPYTCLWGWALVFGHVAVFEGRKGAWAATGLAVGLGILAKYTMVLYLPALGLFLLTSPARRPLLVRPGFWVMTGIAALCSLPILIWNVQHDWVTLRHVGRQAGAGTGAALFLTGPLVYLGTQALLWLGFWFGAWAAALWAARPWREADDGVRYLWWTSATVFGVFLAFSVKTRGGEPNWPVAAYVPGLVLAAGWLARRLEETSGWPRRLTVAGLTAAALLGTLLTLFVHRSDLAYPLLARLAGPPTPERPLPLRRLDPTCRLRGFRTLGSEIDAIRVALRAEGVEPVLVGTGWALPGAVGFYSAEQPEVFSVGPVVGDRRSQYDLWRPNPVDDGDAFRGRTFVVVGFWAPGLAAAFDAVETPRTVTHVERGHPVAAWTVTVCRGFKGFPRSDGPRGD